MRIEHTALYVADLEAARDFFVKYFSAAAGELYHNRVTGFRSYFLTFDDGGRLEIMSKPGVAGEPGERSGYAHIAFALGSREQVDMLTRRLCEDGFKVTSGPRVTGDGYYESCISGIEGNVIELTV